MHMSQNGKVLLAQNHILLIPSQSKLRGQKEGPRPGTTIGIRVLSKASAPKKVAKRKGRPKNVFLSFRSLREWLRLAQESGPKDSRNMPTPAFSIASQCALKRTHQAVAAPLEVHEWVLSKSHAKNKAGAVLKMRATQAKRSRALGETNK